MHTVNQLLQAKGHDVWSISPQASVLDAISLMADKGIGALLVMDDGRLVGIVSERDYARKIILQGRSSKDTSVAEIMTPKVYYVEPTHTIEECMALMTDKHIRHLPVLDNQRVVGVVSIGDVVKTIISQQRFLIEQLEQYITT